MDYGTFRGIFTLVLLVLFIVIVVWAYSKRSKSRFDEAANTIFEDDDVHQNTVSDKEKESEK
jgi:cytochrome c oxidase cbb3-type subunit 4